MAHNRLKEEAILKRTLLMIVLGSALGGLASASTAEFGTAEEAKAMLNRAIAKVKANELAAIKSFNNNDLPFRDRDLFVFCFDGKDGKFTAHESFVDWDVRELRDPNGKSFGMEMYDNAQENRITEVVFTSPTPGSTELSVKKAYVMRVGDQVCGVSAYQLKGNGNPTR
jgi:hypothetical protein